MVDLLDIEVHEPVYRYRVMVCRNDELRNPEKEWDLYFSSDSFRQAQSVKEQETREDKFGDVYRVVDGGAE